MKGYFSLILIFSIFVLKAQQAYLVKDVYTQNDRKGSNAKEFTRMGGYVYFTADSQNGTGEEIYRTDGTTTGTELVADICPGCIFGYSRGPESLTALNNKLYFSAHDGTRGLELWRSDGTAAGTQMVKDIEPNMQASSLPQNLATFNNELYFTINFGQEIWKSDGSETGTFKLKDCSDAEGFTASGTDLYFTSYTANNGVELWATDGTSSGTRLVKDINPGVDDANIEEMTDVNGTLFFIADDGTHGPELWKSDGTSSGTQLVKDICPIMGQTYISGLTNLNGTLLFHAYDGVGGYSMKLWKSDGTAIGTEILSSFSSGGLFASGNTAYFWLNDGTHGAELWITDGTSSGTQMLKDINPGVDFSHPYGFIETNGSVFFQLMNPTLDNQLWKTDGTASGTELVKVLPTTFYLDETEVVNGKLIFKALDENGREPWVSDGTEAGTHILKNLASEKGSSAPKTLGDLNGHLFFGGRDSTDLSSYGLFVSDGTSSGTELLQNSYNYPAEMGTLRGKALVAMITGANTGFGLYSSDGTPSGTTLIKNLLSGRYSYTESFTPYNNLTFFIDDSFLWKTDGTASGTEKVISSPVDEELTNSLGELYFSAHGSNTVGKALFKSDGTSGGTALIKDINPSGSDKVRFMAELKGELFFAASEGGPLGLWKTDGTPQGTEKLKAIVPGRYGFSLLPDMMIFSAYDSINGYELWKTDGTESGTELLKDIFPGVGGSNIRSMVDLKGKVYFSALTPDEGVELWVTDGTAMGTAILKDVYPGSPSGLYHSTSSLIKVNDYIYFAANNGSSGYELWRSDGTESGTSIVMDIVPGRDGSYPMELSASGNKLYFSVFHPDYGRELWALDLPLGLPEVVKTTLKVFPNPTSGLVKVISEKKDEDVEVYDIRGARLLSQKLNDYEARIDLSGYSPGVYLIRIENSTVRLIKH